jgi:hypothetical protein
MFELQYLFIPNSVGVVMSGVFDMYSDGQRGVLVEAIELTLCIAQLGYRPRALGSIFTRGWLTCFSSSDIIAQSDIS